MSKKDIKSNVSNTTKSIISKQDVDYLNSLYHSEEEIEFLLADEIEYESNEYFENFFEVNQDSMTIKRPDDK
jgi:hypothetical protein